MQKHPNEIKKPEYPHSVVSHGKQVSNFFLFSDFKRKLKRIEFKFHKQIDSKEMENYKNL